ncbi:MAG: hypothetical protein JG765_879 [Cereibacter sp.]|nr:hypothetical protein [Cereibacter sp.]
MTATVSTENKLRITLVSASSPAGLAAGLLSSHLPLTRAEAALRLSRQPSVLAEAAPACVARRLQALMAALGLRVRLDDPATRGTADRVDLWFQANDEAAPAAVARLADHLGLAGTEVAQALHSPAGLVVATTAPRAADLRRALRRERSLRSAVSDPAVAIYDLFLLPGLKPTEGLVRLLGRLGSAECSFSGAIAGALDARSAALVQARHGGLVQAINRDFQRFDLYLTGRSGVTAQELADFFATRCPEPRERLMTLEALGPLRIESGLTRSAASQFISDYAAFGIQTCVRRSFIDGAPPAGDPA